MSAIHLKIESFPSDDDDNHNHTIDNILIFQDRIEYGEKWDFIADVPLIIDNIPEFVSVLKRHIDAHQHDPSTHIEMTLALFGHPYRPHSFDFYNAASPTLQQKFDNFLAEDRKIDVVADFQLSDDDSNEEIPALVPV